MDLPEQPVASVIHHWAHWFQLIIFCIKTADENSVGARKKNIWEKVEQVYAMSFKIMGNLDRAVCVTENPKTAETAHGCIMCVP